MNRFFRRIPLPLKLLLIGLVPLILLVYLSLQYYHEKSKEVDLLKSYIDRIDQSADISRLIIELQNERRYTYSYALEKKSALQMQQQRLLTDAAITTLQKNKYSSLKDFTHYTFLENLTATRRKVDSAQISADGVMQFFTNAVVRLNMLNVVAGGNNAYLQPVYEDLAAVQILSQMTTFLGIIHTNIYNVLLTRRYVLETLLGTIGVYQVYKTFELEYYTKARPEAVAGYKNLLQQSELKPTMKYIDTVFKQFKVDSTYGAEEWQSISLKGVDKLRNLQVSLLNSVEQKMNGFYKAAIAKKEQTLFLLNAALVFVIIVVSLSILSITKVLKELRHAAKKLARGGTGIAFKHLPNDAIGSLAHSISNIDENNKTLADAADAIGKGDFNVVVKPRSGEDILGNAIVRMKDNLQKITRENEESRAHLKELADFVPQMFWTSGPDGKADYYNKKWYDFTGFDNNGEIRGWDSIMHPDDKEKCITTWKHSVLTGEPYIMEYRFLDWQKNEYKWFLGKALPVKDADGNIVKWFGSCTEIQDQKMQAEELERKVMARTQDLNKSNAELERSNRDLEQFAYVASHDLQEPVRKIRTFAEIIKERSAEKLDEPSKNYIDKICSSADRMKTIIKDILNFSHLNKNNQAFEPTDLNKILAEIKTDLELVITQKKATITADNLPVVQAMPIQMNQLFYNLINNALKFAKESEAPNITIKVTPATNEELQKFSFGRPVGPYCKIIFTDNGIGFDQKYSQQIFAMFQRLNDRRNYSGTGIGLALCKKIVENHNGFIEADSVIGEGSTFSVFLPEPMQA